MSLSDPYTGPQAPPSVGPCSLQTPTTNLRPSVPSGWGHISLETSRVDPVSLRAPKGRATSPSNPQGKAMPTYLWALSQAHNLASHFDQQAFKISSCILLKYNGKVLVLRIWVADLGQDIGAGAMHIIDTSIKGDVVDAFIGQAAATACRMTGMDTIL